MQRTQRSRDRFAPTVAATVVMAAIMISVSARAQDRLNLPEITITGSPPPSDTGREHCIDTATSNDHSLGCLNERMKREVDRVNPVLNMPPTDAKSSDLKVGVVNIPGVQQQYGQNFGHSVVPFRPPPPIYNSFGRR